MSTSTANRRSKAGYLELHKGGKNWKRYLFKVTGSTYLHYFGEKNPAKAKDEILLVNVRGVDLPAKLHRGAMYVFEVRFSGKSSPWVLSASTQEEQMSWMEAIQPGSSSLVTQYSQVAQLSPPPVALGRNSPIPQLAASISPTPGAQPGMGPTPGAQPAFGYPTVVTPPHGVQVMPGQSAGSQPMPQGTSAYYLPPAVPGHSPGAPAISGLSPGVPAMPGHSPGVPATTGSSLGAQVSPGLSSSFEMTPGNAPQPRPQAASRRQNEPHPPRTGKSYEHFQPPETANHYVPEPYLDPSVLSSCRTPLHNQSSTQRLSLDQHLPTTSSRHPHEDPSSSLPVPAANVRSHQALRRVATEGFIPSSNCDNVPPARLRSPTIPPRPKETLPPEQEYTDMSSPQDEEYTDMSSPKDPNGYLVVSRKPKPKPAPRKMRGQYTLLESPEEESQYKEMVDLLKDQFTPDQLGMLRGMLDMLKTGDGKDGGAGDNSSSASDSGAKSLGYVMSKTVNTFKETMLVTEDDDPSSYDERPSWAKAVTDECLLVDDDDELGEGLNSLEQQVCSISTRELSSLVKIGSGQFGEVFRAHYCPGESVEESVTVAVKKTKDNCPAKEKDNLMQEMAVMSKMVHPNIVKLYGVVTEDVPAPWVVLEYLPNGDLRNYLVTNSPKSPERLVKYMVDVAMGMHYLAERGLVHRDLAARNVLVGEGEMCKVADFGLMRELPKDNSIYQSTSNTPCPIRWMAPECITRRQYSPASDVWAFGILQWEMFNPTKKMPYAGIDNLQVVVKVTTDNYRMPVPRGCPSIVARVMKACWHSDPKRRPSFRLITTLLTTKGLHARKSVRKPEPTDPEVYI